ncbi:hypothetical protein IWQ60_010112, partial [Tieghemiomyces parasiticus]
MPPLFRTFLSSQGLRLTTRAVRRGDSLPRQSVRTLHSDGGSVTSTEPAERVRRALLYVPGSEEKMIAKSLSVTADCVVYDLEDSVAANRKGTARSMVFDALKLGRPESPELAVRINAVGSGLEFDDLHVILQSKKLRTVLVPK